MRYSTGSAHYRIGFFLLLACCCHGGPLETRVDQVFSQWDETNSPGLAVVVSKDGVVVYQHGYGCADLEQGTPIDAAAVFDVASVAKQFTGLAVAMLVEQGKVSLDDEVHKYLPRVPDFGKPISLGELIHHTSGLRDWPETLALAGKDTGDLINLDIILEMVERQKDLDFLPGGRHQYSNTGYNLLAAVIAKVTGQSFGSWMQTNIFRPLGMLHTHVCENPNELIPNRAKSYYPSGQRGDWNPAASRLSAPGSSSVFTTAEDMAKWLLNFETGMIGGKRALEAMLQGAKLNDGTQVNYGFGLMVGDYHGMKMVEHGGAWAGYRSEVMRFPEKRFAVAILGNASNLRTYDLAEKVADIYLGSPLGASSVTPASAAKVDSAHWEDYLGTYRLGPDWWLTISRQGDQLMAQATREAKFKMTPVSDRSFFVEAYGAGVEFVRDGPGAVGHLLYRGINAPRLNLPPATREYLRAYVGDYWSEELRVAYRVEIRNGHLETWHAAGGWMKLLPTALDRFDTDAGLAVEFTRDGASQVSGLKVSGSRIRNLKFLRVSWPKAEAKLKPEF